MMKLTFTLSLDELTFLSIEVLKHSPQYLKSMRKKQVLLLVVYIFITLILYTATLWALFTVLFFLLCVAVIVFFPRFQGYMHKKHFKKMYLAPENKSYLEKQTLTISAKGIEGTSSKTKVSFTWEGILKLVEYEQVYLILVEGSRAWSVPKKVFKKGEEAEFKKLLKKLPYEKMTSSRT